MSGSKRREVLAVTEAMDNSRIMDEGVRDEDSGREGKTEDGGANGSSIEGMGVHNSKECRVTCGRHHSTRRPT